MAQVFLEEILDLPHNEKQNLKPEHINKQIHFKFPEISQEFKLHTVEYLQNRADII